MSKRNHNSHTIAVDSKLDGIRSQVQSALDHGRDSLGELRTQAVRRAKQADQLVRAKPYHAAGIAAGLGVLIGFLVSRRFGGSR